MIPIPRKASLHASSLLITVVIALLIAIVCSSLLLLTYNNSAIDRAAKTDRLLKTDLRSAINMVLADTSLVMTGHRDIIDLFGRGMDTAIVEKENWGLFDVASITVTRHGQQRTRTFFFGPATDTPLDACLYLTQHSIPLYVAGNSMLTGDAYLPKGGIQPAYIDQRSFANAQPLSGTARTSGDSLPPIDPRLITHLSNRDSIGTQQSLPGSLQRFFADSPVIIHIKNPVTLSEGAYRGHIVIISDSSIKAGPGATLEDVILEAPYIELENGFTGAIQAIATDSLVVNNNCHLGYPSCLTLAKRQGSSVQPVIRIADSCIIDGMVLSLAPAANDRIATYVEVGKGSTVTGYLYASGFLYLKGAVQGVVLTDYFLYKSSSSVYQNYLVDARIDRTALSNYFVGPHLFSSTRPNRIMQWVK